MQNYRLFFQCFLNLAVKNTCEANQTGENSSFIFAVCVCVKSVSLYHFKPAYVVLYMTVKINFLKPTSEMEK